MPLIATTSTKLLMSNHDYVTGIDTCEFSNECAIKNFRLGTKKKITTPSFSSQYSDFNDIWTLEIYPTNTDCKNSAYILFDLQVQSFNSSGLQTECKLIINDRREMTKECDFDEFRQKITWNFFIKTSDFFDPSNGYLQNDQLKICCIIKMSRNLKNNSDVTPKFMGTQQLSADLEKLLFDEKSADVTIQVGKKSFRAIKGILGARSPVFAAMFDHEQLKENGKNKVVIEDIDEDVFEEFLHYIYTGESPNVNKMPMELFAVAEKYQVADRFKNFCKNVIGKTINPDNVASILVFSDKYNLKELHEKCLKFMKNNLQDVMSNETFQVDEKKNPEFFLNVLDQLLLS